LRKPFCSHYLKRRIEALRLIVSVTPDHFYVLNKRRSMIEADFHKAKLKENCRPDPVTVFVLLLPSPKNSSSNRAGSCQMSDVNSPPTESLHSTTNKEERSAPSFSRYVVEVLAESSSTVAVTASALLK
jgi:hypothetical protein